jgi:purine-nucleoside phosphorylase
VTNPAAGLATGGLDHAEVLAAGRDAADRVVALLRGVLERLPAAT